MTGPGPHEAGEAYFDQERRYRWALSRLWDDGPMMLFIGLNPSTADENKLDPTMRRVIGFAKREGCGGIWMGNLFAIRATRPKHMLTDLDPVGVENDGWLLDMARWCQTRIVVGWGAHGGHEGRSGAVRRLLQGYELRCLGTTATGEPKHPLYLRADAPLTTWQDATWRPAV